MRALASLIYLGSCLHQGPLTNVLAEVLMHALLTLLLAICMSWWHHMQSDGLDSSYMQASNNLMGHLQTLSASQWRLFFGNTATELDLILGCLHTPHGSPISGMYINSRSDHDHDRAQGGKQIALQSQSSSRSAPFCSSLLITKTCIGMPRSRPSLA